MTTARASGPHPHPRVTYLVKRLELAVRTRLDGVTGAHGLTTPQYAALSVLHLKPGVSSAELARLSFVSAQAMNEMVSALEEKDLVYRRPAPDHRKIRHIFLTENGERVLRACEETVDDVEQEMLATLEADEIRAFASTLRRCSEALTAPVRGS